METITNAASAVASTASNLIYGQPAKENEAPIAGNETAGKEPLSGEQGKGTATDPFDQGNKEEFLKLDPAEGKPTKSFGDNASGAKGETSLPIILLNPDVAASSSTTGVTDKAGVSDQTWKPTALDEVKPEGAPGAGPAPPANVTPATGDLSSSKSDEPTAKDTTTSATDSTTAPKESSDSSAPKEPPQQHSVGSDIDKILESQPKSKHSVDDSEASDLHSKMMGTTVRQTDASQHGESANTKTLAEDKTANTSTSHGSSEASGEKPKLSTKEKLKQKLHIGHKDK